MCIVAVPSSSRSACHLWEKRFRIRGPGVQDLHRRSEAQIGNSGGACGRMREALFLLKSPNGEMGLGQYLLIPFLGGWTSIYQLFWCSPGVQGFDTLPNGDNVGYKWLLDSSMVQFLISPTLRCLSSPFVTTKIQQGPWLTLAVHNVDGCSSVNNSIYSLAI